MQTRVRRSSTQRRREIADAILRIIGEEGLPSVTMNVIAEEVGLTSGALFRHFSTREEMLEAAVHRGLARVAATYPDDAEPPMERLLELGRRRIRLLSSDPGLAWLLRSDEALLTLPPSAVTAIRTVAARSRDYILKALRDAADEGSIRSDIEPGVLLVPFVGTVHALIGARGAQRFATEKMEAESDRVLQSVLTLFKNP